MISRDSIHIFYFENSNIFELIASRQHCLVSENGYQLVIKIVLYYNNHNSISTYDPDEDIPPTLPHVPIDLWNWGIEYRTGRLRRPDKQLVKVNLIGNE